MLEDTTVLQYLESKEFIDKLLSNEYFIKKLAEKLSEEVETNDLRLLSSELAATLDVEDIEKEMEDLIKEYQEQINKQIENKSYREIK